MNSIVIGKRIPIGAAVGGIITLLSFLWDTTHPGNELPGHVVMAISTAAVAVVQVFVVNKYGATQVP